MGKGKRLMGLNDIIGVLDVRNPFYKLGHLKAWHISIPVSHLYYYYVYILKDFMNHIHMITVWKKCVVLFSITEASLGNTNM